MTRVAVFIDYQNVYMQARDCFSQPHDPAPVGQIHPLLTGILVSDRGRSKDPLRQLERVHIYRGQPSGEHSPMGLGASQCQVAAWSAKPRVHPTTRPLHYHRRGLDSTGQPTFEAREKGIDVLIALGMVLGAERDDYDVAVLFSADTDLIPAVDAVRSIRKRCEVAAWQPLTLYGNGLRIPGVWCHRLDQADYGRLHDPTDYTKAAPNQ